MKNKIILLVSMLLPLVSSCGEKPIVEPSVKPTVEPTPVSSEPSVEPSEELIPEVNYDEFITHKYDDILNDVWFPNHYSPAFELSPWYVHGINVFEEYNVTIISFDEAKKKDMLLCGYVNSDVVDRIRAESIIIPSDYYPSFLGEDELYAKYCQLLNKEEKILSPIVWYEFNENFDIPDVIDNKKIIMKSNIYEIPIYELDGEYVQTMDMLVEGKYDGTDKQLSIYTYQAISKLDLFGYGWYAWRSVTIVDGIKCIGTYSKIDELMLFEKKVSDYVEMIVGKDGKHYLKIDSLAAFIKENKK